MSEAEEWLLQALKSIPDKIEQDKIDIIKAIFSEECVAEKRDILIISDLLTASILESKGIPPLIARHLEDAIGNLRK